MSKYRNIVSSLMVGTMLSTFGLCASNTSRLDDSTDFRVETSSGGGSDPFVETPRVLPLPPIIAPNHLFNTDEEQVIPALPMVRFNGLSANLIALHTVNDLAWTTMAVMLMRNASGHVQDPQERDNYNFWTYAPLVLFGLKAIINSSKVLVNRTVTRVTESTDALKGTMQALSMVSFAYRAASFVVAYAMLSDEEIDVVDRVFLGSSIVGGVFSDIWDVRQITKHH